MKSLVTVQNLYRRGRIFKGGEEQKKDLEIRGIGEGNITLGGEPFDRAMADTLSRLTLLYDVPFSYLVPDEAMLPEESIRFFRLDPLWIKSLLDGALSVGRNTEYDYQHDAALIDSIYRCAVKNNMQVRANLSEHEQSEKFREEYREISDRIEKDTVYSGFLLRSAMAADFEGLEVEGIGKTGEREEKLLIARFDKLSQDVLLCLFCGKLTKLHIKQPPEGIHLGFLSDGTKTLRSMEDGHLLSESVSIWQDDGERAERDRENGVLRYHQIADRMKPKLGGQEPDSAVMAVQLIQNALVGEFELLGG